MMDEENERFIQRLAATAATHRFMLDFLLRAELGRLGRDDRHSVADWLRNASKQTQAFHGQSKNDFQAAAMADLLIDMQGQIGEMIDSALQALDEAADRS